MNTPQALQPLVRKMAPTATRLIRTDHAHVMSQFHKLQADTRESVCAAVARNICSALEIHAQIEEAYFYPALREAGLTSPTLDKSVSEHEEMRRLIERVRQLDGQHAAQREALNDLLNVVMHHVADEETRLLPAAERAMNEAKLSEIGAQMQARRMALARPHAGEMAADHVRAAPAKTALMAVGALVAGGMLVGSLRRGRAEPEPWVDRRHH